MQQAVSEKISGLFRELLRTRDENDQEKYREANKESKRVVAMPNANSQLFEELEWKE